jgi:beta-glucosidase/6-phospho-beta-glucosidase/beta-galactosidase
MDIWLTLNEDNVIVNRFEFPKGLIPPPTHETHTNMLSFEDAQIGWIYKEGKLIKPVETTGFVPIVVPSDPRDKTIEDLKADVLTLTGSLTQVIKVLNAITAPPVVQSSID